MGQSISLRLVVQNLQKQRDRLERKQNYAETTEELVELRGYVECIDKAICELKLLRDWGGANSLIEYAKKSIKGSDLFAEAETENQ